MSSPGGHLSTAGGLEGDMARNRYIKDYRIVETVNERGRIRSDYEYIGPPYSFIAPAEKIARLKKLLPALSILAWLLYVGAMLPRSLAMKTWYVSLPFAFTAVPLAMLTELCFSLYHCKEPMEHRVADKLENAYPARSLWAGAMAAVSLLGQLVNLIRGQSFLPGDLAFTLCAAGLLACGALFFRERGLLRTRKGK